MEKPCLIPLGEHRAGQTLPLTEAGERGIRELGLGLKEAGLSFEEAVSSDSGRTIQTMGIILQELGLTGKSLIVMTNGSVSGVLVVLTALMMAISSWGFYPVSLRSMISIS